MTYGRPEVKPEEFAADKADNPHAIEHDGISSDNENGDACMASPPPLPPLPVWQTSTARYNTKSISWAHGIEMDIDFANYWDICFANCNKN